MILLSGLANLAGSILAKVAKGAPPLHVCYTNPGGVMKCRPFHNQSKAVEFQRALSKQGVASLLIQTGKDGTLSCEKAVVAMTGLGDAWIAPALIPGRKSKADPSMPYGLPRGENPDSVRIGGKRGKKLIRVKQADAQAIADRYGPFPEVKENDLPYYDRRYGQSYSHREVPEKFRQPVMFRGRGYNLVNINTDPPP